MTPQSKLPIIDIRTFSPVAKVGVAVCMLSLLFWISLPIIPFLPMAGKQKAAWAFGVFVAAEVTFYLGLALVGKDVVQGIRSRFKRKQQAEAATSAETQLTEDET